MLALQEVGPADGRRQPPRSHDSASAARGVREPDGCGIRVALLSTRPLDNPPKIWDDPATQADDAVREMGRGALAATVTVDGHR